MIIEVVCDYLFVYTINSVYLAQTKIGSGR